MAPQPDDKDWTWVVERRCGECGFDAAVVDPLTVAARLREIATQWADLLGRDEALVRTRPSPTTWSALEYGCHVRDVCVLYEQRLDLMLTEDGPRYPNWDQDATALEVRYHESDPAIVAGELVAAATSLAARFDTVAGDDWERTGYRSDGAGFTVDTFARYFLHDLVHHVHDVEVGFAAVTR